MICAKTWKARTNQVQPVLIHLERKRSRKRKATVRKRNGKVRKKRSLKILLAVKLRKSNQANKFTNKKALLRMPSIA